MGRLTQGAGAAKSRFSDCWEVVCLWECENGLSMTDYVYLDVFIEVRGRFWIIYQNFTNDVEMKIASCVYLSRGECSGRLRMY